MRGLKENLKICQLLLVVAVEELCRFLNLNENLQGLEWVHVLRF